MLLTNPLVVLGAFTRIARAGYASGLELPVSVSSPRSSWLSPSEVMYGSMVVTQAMAGLVFVGLSIAGLRPLRGTSWPGARPRTGWWTRLSGGARRISRAKAAVPVARNRILSAPARRRPCGDSPMLWKERYTTMGGGLRWLGSRYVVLFFGVLLGCYLLDVDRRHSRRWPGAGLESRGGDHRRVAQASAVLAVLGMLTVAAASAVSLTGEREQDTWISLATTLLTPGEVVRAKQFGAVWSARRVGLCLLVVWGVGFFLGAIHPLGVLAALVFVASWPGSSRRLGCSSRPEPGTRPGR